MKFSYLKNFTVKTSMHLMAVVAFIIIAGIVVLLIFISIDKKNTNLKPVQLTLSLIQDKKFLASIKL